MLGDGGLGEVGGGAQAHLGFRLKGAGFGQQQVDQAHQASVLA